MLLCGPVDGYTARSTSMTGSTVLPRTRISVTSKNSPAAVAAGAAGGSAPRAYIGRQARPHAATASLIVLSRTRARIVDMIGPALSAKKERRCLRSAVPVPFFLFLYSCYLQRSGSAGRVRLIRAVAVVGSSTRIGLRLR